MALTGASRATVPRIRAMLAMFEPSALPIARPGLPSRLDSVAMNISGEEVPKPTTWVWLNPGCVQHGESA